MFRLASQFKFHLTTRSWRRCETTLVRRFDDRVGLSGCRLNDLRSQHIATMFKLIGNQSITVAAQATCRISGLELNALGANRKQYGCDSRAFLLWRPRSLVLDPKILWLPQSQPSQPSQPAYEAEPTCHLFCPASLCSNGQTRLAGARLCRNCRCFVLNFPVHKVSIMSNPTE